MTADPSILARDLDWPGCTNVRDLGGLPTADGGQTRRGALLRSDMLYRLTPAGREAFLAAGVHTIVDLRTAGELAVRPSPFDGADDNGPRYLHLPLLGSDPAIDDLLRATQTRTESYIVILEHCAPYVAGVLRAIATYDDGPVVYHCFAGKDRTGIVSALLLTLADVPEALIAADYAHTETRGWAAYDTLVAENGGKEISAEDMAAPAQAMQDTLAYLRATYGSVPGYLLHAGLNEAELTLLRARLRG